MKSAYKMILVFSLLTNVAFADWEEWSGDHFKSRIGDKNPESFVQEEVNKLVQAQNEPYVMKTITLCDSVVTTYLPVTRVLDSSIKDDDLVSKSYVPHLWIRRDLEGNIVEFGSSFMREKSLSSNPKMIEQEVFMFQGDKAKQAFIANW